MNEVWGNLWTCSGVKVIPTNGIAFDVKEGRTKAVMGAGVALQARQRFPGIEYDLGRLLKTHGNRVHVIQRGAVWDESTTIITFPTKHHFHDQSDIALIERSARQLVEVVDEYGFPKVVLPRPGCGLGGLKWKQVCPVIERHLDGRFWVVERPERRGFD